MSEPRVEVVDDPALAVGALLATQAVEGGAIVLTGGTSVERAYLAAAAAAPDWRAVSLWWSDERCVPPSDERSNFGLGAAHAAGSPQPPPRSCTASRASFRRRRRPRRTTARSRAWRSTCCFSGSAPTGISPPGSPARVSCASARARATCGDAGARTVRRTGHDDAADAAARASDRAARHRRRQGTRRSAATPSAARSARWCRRACCARVTSRSRSTPTRRPPRPSELQTRASRRLRRYPRAARHRGPKMR